MRLNPARYPFIPKLAVWCTAHKRHHPLGQACSACVEGVYADAVAHGDPDAPIGAVVQIASEKARMYTVGAVGIQRPASTWVN